MGARPGSAARSSGGPSPTSPRCSGIVRSSPVGDAGARWPRHRGEPSERRAIMGKLDGKVALVTGSSSGIGEGIARGLAAEGGAVALVARRAERLRKLADEIAAAGGAALALPADVTSESQVEQVFAATVERFSRLDIDRKSTRLNSSHQIISYAVFCLKKKNKIPTTQRR